MTTAVLAIEGVLGDSFDFSMTMLTTPAARKLYAALESYYRIVLLTSEPSYEKASFWLRTNGFQSFGLLVNGQPEALDHMANRFTQLRALRSSRTVVEIVVDADPLVVAHAMATGSTGLLWGNPRPASQRLDMQTNPIRDWSAIEHEQDLQRAAEM